MASAAQVVRGKIDLTIMAIGLSLLGAKNGLMDRPARSRLVTPHIQRPSVRQDTELF